MNKSEVTDALDAAILHGSSIDYGLKDGTSQVVFVVKYIVEDVTYPDSRPDAFEVTLVDDDGQSYRLDSAFLQYITEA